MDPEKNNSNKKQELEVLPIYLEKENFFLFPHLPAEVCIAFYENLSLKEWNPLRLVNRSMNKFIIEHLMKNKRSVKIVVTNAS